MFSKPTAPVVEPTPVVTEQGDSGRTSLIPLSHLELDLPAPTTGWLIELDRRGITVVTDDLGRKAISRDDARQLFIERREVEARAREVAAQNEQRMIEQDRVWRAGLNKGVEWWRLPDNTAPGDAMLWLQLKRMRGRVCRRS